MAPGRLPGPVRLSLRVDAGRLKPLCSARCEQAAGWAYAYCWRRVAGVVGRNVLVCHRIGASCQVGHSSPCCNECALTRGARDVHLAVIGRHVLYGHRVFTQCLVRDIGVRIGDAHVLVAGATDGDVTHVAGCVLVCDRSVLAVGAVATTGAVGFIGQRGIRDVHFLLRFALDPEVLVAFDSHVTHIRCQVLYCHITSRFGFVADMGILQNRGLFRRTFNVCSTLVGCNVLVCVRTGLGRVLQVPTIDRSDLGGCAAD